MTYSVKFSKKKFLFFLLMFEVHIVFIIVIFDKIAVYSGNKWTLSENGRMNDVRRKHNEIRTNTLSSPLSSLTKNDSAKRKTLEQILKRLLKYKRPPDSYYNYNVTASDNIPVEREIDDIRPKECRNISYNLTALPTVSVIIPFYNEPLTVLLRTVHSLVSRSPPELLREIILVDDNSTHAYFGKEFQNYLSILDSKITLIRNEKREGVVKSRLKGANKAQGEVLIFLDAHTECLVGWLEPLLVEINRFSNIVVQPHLLAISQNVMSYPLNSQLQSRGGFGWDMRYSWFSIPNYLTQFLTSPAEPVPTPVLVGCAIAVRKSYFNSIGAFDEDLHIWGGEQLDLSFRTWMCGGRITTVPCSCVGHIYKKNSYSFDGDREMIICKNLRRVAEIWMGKYKVFIHAALRGLFDLPPMTSDEKKSLEERIKLKRKLQCKNFKWFLENIMPEMKIPTVEAVFHGEIINAKTSGCITVLEDGYLGVSFRCLKYHISPENTFTIDVHGRLVYDNRCVHVDDRFLLLTLGDCLPPDRLKGVSWTLSPGPYFGKLVYKNFSKTWCAVHVTNVDEVHKFEQMVQMYECEPKTKYHYWKMTYKFVYT